MFVDGRLPLPSRPVNVSRPTAMPPRPSRPVNGSRPTVTPSRPVNGTVPSRPPRQLMDPDPVVPISTGGPMRGRPDEGDNDEERRRPPMRRPPRICPVEEDAVSKRKET